MSEQFKTHIRNIAKHMPYPTMPAIQKTRRQTIKLAWHYVALILLLFGLSSLGIPDIRAAVLEFFQIGAVTIYLEGKNEVGELLNLADVSGETTLADAQNQANFTLSLPPNDLPDRVFVQDGDLVIFVWLQENSIEKALYQTVNNSWRLTKIPGNIIKTEVGGNQGYWASSGVTVQFSKDDIIQTEWTHFVDGNVLGWEQNGITFRLETDLSLDEARTLAESLQVMQ